MFSFLSIGPLETTGLVVLFGLSAVGAVLIVRDVFLEFKKIYTNKVKGIKDYDED